MANFYYTLLTVGDKISPIANLAIRLWIAKIFFESGLVKIKSFESTLQLFEWEYNVPLVSHVFAAYSATAVELIAPVLLVIGLAGRFSAASLFVLNFVAVIAYADISQNGINQHIGWGIMLLIPLLHGPGKLSIDHFIRRKYELGHSHA